MPNNVPVAPPVVGPGEVPVPIPEVPPIPGVPTVLPPWNPFPMPTFTPSRGRRTHHDDDVADDHNDEPHDNDDEPDTTTSTTTSSSTTTTTTSEPPPVDSGPAAEIAAPAGARVQASRLFPRAQARAAAVRRWRPWRRRSRRAGALRRTRALAPRAVAPVAPRAGGTRRACDRRACACDCTGRPGGTGTAVVWKRILQRQRIVPAEVGAPCRHPRQRRCFRRSRCSASSVRERPSQSGRLLALATACSHGDAAQPTETPSSQAAPAPVVPAPAPKSTPPTLPPVAPNPYDFGAVSTLINDAIAANRLPGAVVQIGHGGQIVFHKAYGERKLAGEPGLDGSPAPAEPMTEDTIFDMASLTKPLATATAVMQLTNKARLQFDDPVQKYLPDFNTANDPQRAKVTVRMLLTHTSGETGDVELKDPWGLDAADKTGRPSSCAYHAAGIGSR